ncbi:PQQ-dependent sugar dehydrogenase [Prosthecobacter sp. SYSU 5D2]|uniref:PQQ-dependent sugar dehydrogenase n=1 Tax=Prosthecobacter sp. SYSU 5D2 TaxID=3134134 RepID=UPI0031FF08E2
MKALRRLAALLLCLPATGHAAFPALSLKPVCEDLLHAPTNITHAGDGSGRLFFCDQPGQVYVFKGGMLQPVPFLDLGSTGLNRVFFHAGNPNAYSERGLLGMAFHPEYENPESAGYRCFYVNYTAVSTTPTDNPSSPQNCVTVISEFRVSENNPDVADATSERILLTYGQPQTNHNGGQIEFGPDGMLYIGSGDGGGANDNAIGHTGGTETITPGRVTGTLGNAQDTTKLLGKILRIDPLGSDGPGGAYGIPDDNPFAHNEESVRKEIYAFGLRNPWRFSFDQEGQNPTRLICADVGQVDVEEINLIVAGGNYGWRVKEGSLDFDATAPDGGGALIPPVAEYAHPSATLPGTELMPKFGTSITGGYIYRGSAIPQLQGKYLFGDYAANGIGGGGGIFLGLEENTPGGFTLSQVTPFNSLPAAARIYAFGVDETGEMYVATKTTAGVLALDGGHPAGMIYKIMPAGESTLSITASKDNTLYEMDAEDVADEKKSSNGKGIYLFAGKTGEMANYVVRRAVMRFDVSSIPDGVEILSASVRLHLSKQVGEGFPMKLHRLTAEWGEGNSDAGDPGGAGVAPQTGDATWTHRFHNTQTWSMPGGDFAPAASATYAIGSSLQDPFPTWTSEALLQDVLYWKENPALNFGWILLGDETQTFSAQRFSSRENATAGNRPQLRLTYTSMPLPTHFEQWLATHFPDEPAGFYLADDGDEDGDGIANLHEYAFGLSPVAGDDEGNVTVTTAPGTGDQVQHLLTFRRDSAATDLTYELQTSPDLVTWTTLATSLAGTSAQGSNGGIIVSDAALAGSVRLVTVRENLSGDARQRRFVRVHVTRSF